MKTIYIRSFLLSIVSVTIFSFVFTSCGNDGDTTAPVINLIAPADEAVLKIGSAIHFEMELSDNEMLSSYKVDIHDNMSDPHEHQNSLRSESNPKYFSYQKTWRDIEGLKNAHIHHEDIEIPEDVVAGDYHMVVYCTDAAGNESHMAIHIELSHDGEAHDH